MLSRALGLVVLLGAGGAAAWAFSPGFRAQMAAMWDSQAGWTEAARRSDPAGFVAHAEAKLQQDLATMEQTRRELAAEVGRLSKTAREQSALAEQARTLAEQFRAEYQRAKDEGTFPIEVRGAAYTEPQEPKAGASASDVDASVEVTGASFPPQSPFQSQSQTDGKGKPRAAKGKKPDRTKPIFQQS